MSAGARRGGGERGRRGGGSAGPQFTGTAGVCCLENCGDVSPPPRRDTRPPGTSQSVAQNQPRTASVHIPYKPYMRGLKQLKGQLWDFLLGRCGLVRVFVRGSISFKKIVGPAFLASWAS